MKRIFFAIISVLVVLIMSTQSVYADPWFAGNCRTSAYGVQSDITDPTSAPTLYSGLIAGWVATSIYNGSWAETGWVQVYGYAPWSFVEIMWNGGDHYISYKSQLSYNDTSNYKMYFYGM